MDRAEGQATRESENWCSYFHRNLGPQEGFPNQECLPREEDFPWDDAYRLTPRERSAIEKSIQQFQLGEGSDGKRLLRRGREFGRAAGDPHFETALQLFIGEEQRHSGHLGEFMRRQCIGVLSKHWVDTVFRRLRGLAGLELSLRVLVTAELIAVPYYRALHDATSSSMLRAICLRILRDEAGHLRFQGSMLARVGGGRGRCGQCAIAAAHGIFLVGTSLVVWMGHRRVFAAAGYTLDQFIEETMLGFLELNVSRRRLANGLDAGGCRVPLGSEAMTTNRLPGQI